MVEDLHCSRIRFIRLIDFNSPSVRCQLNSYQVSIELYNSNNLDNPLEGSRIMVKR